MRSGEIVLVKFPFSDLQSNKRRPALVLTRSEITGKVGVLTIAMITSKIEGLKFPGDYHLQSWKSAGLLFPSLIRLAKIATIDKDLVDKPLGSLSTIDVKGVRISFRKHFKSWL